MFCKSCGKEIPETARFCNGCGAPVFRPEPPADPVPPPESAPPAAPAPESAPRDELAAALETAAVPVPVTEIQPVPAGGNGGAGGPGGPAVPIPKKKPPILLLAAVAAVIAAVAAVVLLVKLLPSGGGEVFVYRTEDDELMFRKDLKAKTEAVELTDDAPAGVRLTKDGKYIYFLEGMDEETSTLYRAETAKIGKKNFSPEKVSSDVNRYGITLLPSGGALYIRGSGEDGQLRFYDGKESYKLASGVSGSDYSVDEAGSFAYYTETDPSDYTMSLYRVRIGPNGEKEKLLKDADVIYSAYDAGVLVYGRSNGETGDWEEETYDVYSQIPGGEKTKLLSGVSDVLHVSADGTKVSLVYLTARTEEHTLYDFVSDSLASGDAQEKEPDYSDYQTRNAWGWTTTDWDAYNEAYEKWSLVNERNYIRQALRETEHNVTTYDLSVYEAGTDLLLASELAFYPTCSAEAGVYLYAKSEQEVSAVCDVKDLDYWEDVYERMGTAEQAWYQNVGGVESPLDLDGDSGLGSLTILNGDEAVLVVYEDGEALLQSYSVDKSALTFVSTITDEDFSSLAKGVSGKKDALYYFTDLDSGGESGELICYAGGKTVSVAKDAARVVVLDDGSAAFKLEDVVYNDRRGIQEGSLYVMKDGKGQRIADDVYASSIAYLDARRVVYISDGDLFVWNGKDSEKLASDAAYFWTNGQADRRTYSCS